MTTPVPPPTLTPDPPAATGQHGLTVGQALGEVAWLLTQSPRHKHLFLADLEWLVMPPLVLGYFRIFRQGDQPTGFASWGQVSPAIATRLASGQARLGPGEWNSGADVWLVDLVAPFGGAADMLADLAQGPLAGRTVKYCETGADGVVVVKALG